MNTDQFQHQVVRLQDVYGEKTYGKERVKLIWETVRNLDLRFFESVVSHIIKTSRTPPLIPEITEAIIQVRRHQSEVQKKAGFAKQVEPLSDSAFSPDDVKMMFRVVKGKLEGKVSAEEWQGFHEWVLTVVALSKQKRYRCNRCFDSGFASVDREIEGHIYQYAERCVCNWSNQ